MHTTAATHASALLLLLRLVATAVELRVVVLTPPPPPLWLRAGLPRAIRGLLCRGLVFQQHWLILEQ